MTTQPIAKTFRLINFIAALVLFGALPANAQWTLHTGTQLTQVDPCPSNDCAYSGPNLRFAGITAAWSGGAYDTCNDRMLIFGGGHNAYYGNEIVAVSPVTNTVELVSSPSVFKATAEHERDGKYPDGTPVSRHTYNAVQFDEDSCELVVIGGYAFSPSGNGGDSRLWRYGSQWRHVSTGDNNGSLLAGVTAYNRVTKTFYQHREGGGRFYAIDAKTNTFKHVGRKALAQYATAAVDTKRNRMFVLGGKRTFAQAFYWQLSKTPKAVDIKDDPDFESSGGMNLARLASIGMDYSPVADAYVVYTGGKSLYVINADTFEVKKYTPPGADSPGPAEPRGTNGRFRYIPSLDRFMVVNSVNQRAASLRIPKFEPSKGTPREKSDQGKPRTNERVVKTPVKTPPLQPSRQSSRAYQASGDATPTDVGQNQRQQRPGGQHSDEQRQRIELSESSAPLAAADWATRSSAPGVLQAFGFDTLEEVTRWIHPDRTKDHVSHETAITASGAGALRMDVRKGDGAASGSWRTFLSPDARDFKAGDVFYVSWRQYFPEYFATHVFNGGGGWKHMIISRNASVMNGRRQNCAEGCGSNQLNEIVTNNYLYRGYIQGYNREGSGKYAGWDDPIRTACNRNDFVYQNQIDHGRQSGGNACERDRKRLGGLYSYGGRKAQDTTTGAMRYATDAWMTFKLRVQIGEPREQSKIELWAAYDGQPFNYLIRKNVNLSGGPPHNTVWLLPYDTGKKPDSARQDTFTLYDELIVSEHDIAPPL